MHACNKLVLKPSYTLHLLTAAEQVLTSGDGDRTACSEQTRYIYCLEKGPYLFN